MLKNKRKLIFAGTPEFAAEHLKALHEADHEILLVLTQPDARVGRGRKSQPTPVKAFALAHNMPVLQPETLKGNQRLLDEIKSAKADFMIVVAYGLIIPVDFLNAPHYGCLNVHGSILPRWRGAAPVQRAIESQDSQTGVCIMQMDEGLDTGPVRHQKITGIQHETSADLLNRLAVLGAAALLEVLDEPARFLPVAQTQEGVTYAHKIHKAEKNIDWTQAAAQLDAKVRALQPWPSVMVTTQAYEFKILQTAVDVPCQKSVEPGQITAVQANGIQVACGNGSDRLLIQQVQLSGKKPMSVRDFLNGKPDYFTIGDSLITMVDA